VVAAAYVIFAIVAYWPVSRIIRHSLDDVGDKSSDFARHHVKTVSEERDDQSEPVSIAIQFELALCRLDFHEARLLLQKGADPNRNSPLSRICGSKMSSTARTIEMIDLLLEFGADIDGDGNTVPLCEAARSYETDARDHYESVMKHLLERGADINGDGKHVPLIEAFKGSTYQSSCQNSAYFLLRNGAAVEIKDEQGDTPSSVVSRIDSYYTMDSSRHMLSHYGAIRNRESQ